MGDRVKIMTLNNLYKMIKEEKKFLIYAKETDLKYPDIVNHQVIEYSENYIKRLIKEYREKGGKRNV